MVDARLRVWQSVDGGQQLEHLSHENHYYVLRDIPKRYRMHFICPTSPPYG